MEPIRLLLVDDHDVVRTGLRMLLESQPDLQIVGEAASGQAGLQSAIALRPDVIVMDITLPDLSGIEATRQVKEYLPAAQVVILTIHEDEQYFFEALKAGAAGYVPKRAAPEDLINAIRAAHSGEMYIYPTLARALVSDYLTRAHSENPEQDAQDTIGELTPREQEVLALLADGQSNDDIAARLEISRHTVARHRENLMRKLGLHNRSDLVKYAIRKGLIAP